MRPPENDQEPRGVEALEAAREMWRRGEPDSGRGRFDEEETLMTIREKTNQFERAIRRRDRIEAAAGLLLVGVAGWVSVLAPGWAPKAGAGVLVASVAFVVHRLWSVRRRGLPADPGLPLIDGLRAELSRVDDQIALLRSVATWYVMPLALGATAWMVSLGLALPLPPEHRPAAALLLGGAGLAILAVVGVLVVQLNRHAVRRQLLPLREEIAASLEEV